MESFVNALTLYRKSLFERLTFFGVLKPLNPIIIPFEGIGAHAQKESFFAKLLLPSC